MDIEISVLVSILNIGTYKFMIMNYMSSAFSSGRNLDHRICIDHT